jgi:HAD superfamily hydrolase (TIGR01509 family)
VTTLRAVLFDMDGTLTDSEKLWTIALDRTAADLGGRLSTKSRRAMVGHNLIDSITMLLADIGSRSAPAAAAELLTGHMKDLFTLPMPWRPGADNLLQAVRRAGIATALVTATDRPLVALALDTLGHNTFDAVVCGDEVQKNKPDPEPYQRAMELLDVQVTECVAVEDSPNGSLSALRAGLPVLVVPSEVEVPPAAGLTFADSLTDVSVDTLRALRGHSVPLPH